MRGVGSIPPPSQGGDASETIIRAIGKDLWTLGKDRLI